MFEQFEVQPCGLMKYELEELAEGLMFYYQEPGASRDVVEDLMADPIPEEIQGVLSRDPRLLLGYVTHRAREALRDRRTNLLFHRDRYYYRPVDVMKMLKTVKDPEEWESTYVPGDARWIKGNDSMEVLADVLLALPKLDWDSMALLESVYWQGHEPERDEEWVAVRAAVIELTRRMNAQDSPDGRGH